MKIRIVALAALVAAAFVMGEAPRTADAQVPVSCTAVAFRQFDLAGVYVSAASMMRLEVFPCGGVKLSWRNEYGDHEAGYASYERAPTGGVYATPRIPDVSSGGYLDGGTVLGIKSGSPGYVEVFTANQYGQVTGPYTLQKLR